MGVIAGDIVAVQGLGGLGHLAIQYARKMGYRTVALSRGTAKKDFAMKLGANDYIDTDAQDAAQELQKMGGAACIAVTAPNPDIITPLLEGLAPGGTLLLWTAIGPVPVNTVSMVLNALSVRGWPSGHSLDSEEAIAFADTHGVECMIEKFPLEKANEAMEHMLSGKVRFRVSMTVHLIPQDQTDLSRSLGCVDDVRRTIASRRDVGSAVPNSICARYGRCSGARH